MVVFKKIAPFLIIFVLALPSVLPLFHSGYFPMHDNTQPTRVYEMAGALRDGQFPVRWVSDLGYGFGYPIFNFYSPLPYYFGALGVLAGLDSIVATKLMFSVAIILAGFSMFSLGKKLWGYPGGIIAALLYLYAPYHGVQVYVRGAVGEYWAYGLLPLIFYGVSLAAEGQWWGILVAGVTLAGVILSHNIISMLAVGFLVAWFILAAILAIVRKKTFILPKSLLLTVFLGLGLAAFFWIPAIFEANLTKIHTLISGSNDFRQHFVFLDQLWSSPWGYGGSAPGRADGFSFMIGKVHIVLELVVLAGFLFNGGEIRKKRGIFALLLSGLIGATVMMLPVTQPIWEVISPLSFVQYPWRFLVFSAFFISILGGSCTLIVARSKIGKFSFIYWLLLIILAGGIVLFNAKYFRPQFYSKETSADFIAPQRIKWNISKISDEYLPKNFPTPQNESEVNQSKIRGSGGIIVESSEIKSQQWHAIISAPQAAEIVFSIAYFPGWKIFIDATPVKPLIRDGLVTFDVTAGRHILTAYFDDTPVRALGNLISLITIMICSIVVIQKLRHEKN